MPYDPFQEPLNSPRHPSFPKPIRWQPPEPPLIDPQIPPKGYAPNPFAPFRNLVRPPLALPPALPAAAEKPGLLGRLAPALGRLTPYAIPLIPAGIAGLLQPFAPGVQRWLKDGWKRPGYGIPDDLAPGTVLPGSRPVPYDVYVRKETYSGACAANAVDDGYRGRYIGPISTVTGGRQITSDDICRGGGDTADTQSVVDGNGGGIIAAYIWGKAPRGSLTVRAVPVDGIPEGVPDPSLPPIATPYPPTQNPKQGLPSLAPEPQRARDPRTLNPYPTEGERPTPIRPPSQRPGGTPALPPATSPRQGTPPTPRPGSGTGTGSPPISLPQPSAPPSPPPQLPDISLCDDPCMQRIARQLDDIKKKQDEQQPQQPSDCPDTEDISFTVISCQDGRAKSEVITITAISPVPSSVHDALRVMADLAIGGCGAEAVVTQPDWWQVRIGANRPQIVVAYRVANTRAYHQISLPHPKNVSRWTENLLGNYEKGSWEGCLLLSDNSRFTINCSTEAEAKRMLAKARTLINPAFFNETSQDRLAIRGGNAILPGSMIAVKAQYFSTGQRSTKADWTVKLAAI